jgi:hypothetical protein
MVTRYGYSRALRTLGQTLEERGIDFFDLRCDQSDFFLQCGDPAPPYLSLIELYYSLGDLDDLDLDARARRGNQLHLVNFQGLPEILRAVGRHLEEREGRLLRICNSDASIPDSYIQLEYQTRDGRTHKEDLFVRSLADDALRMYRERSRGSDSRVRK